MIVELSYTNISLLSRYISLSAEDFSPLPDSAIRLQPDLEIDTFRLFRQYNNNKGGLMKAREGDSVSAKEFQKLSSSSQVSLVEFFKKSPLYGVDLDLERSKEPPRKVRLCGRFWNDKEFHVE